MRVGMWYHLQWFTVKFCSNNSNDNIFFQLDAWKTGFDEVLEAYDFNSNVFTSLKIQYNLILFIVLYMYEGRGGNVVSCKMILCKFLCKFLLK